MNLYLEERHAACPEINIAREIVVFVYTAARTHTVAANDTVQFVGRQLANCWLHGYTPIRTVPEQGVDSAQTSVNERCLQGLAGTPADLNP
jgi:hypothetical protein